MTRANVDTRPEILSSAVFDDIRKDFDPRSAILASMIAGLAYLVTLLILVPLVYGFGIWAPFRMIGAVILGREVLPPSATLDPVLIAVAVLVLLATSLIYGFIGMAVLRPYHPITALVGGTAFGLLLYLFNFYILSAIFPWQVNFRGWVTLLGHLLFGLVLGGAYLSSKIAREGHQRHGVARFLPIGNHLAETRKPGLEVRKAGRR